MSAGSHGDAGPLRSPTAVGRGFDRAMQALGMVGICWVVFIAVLVNADVLSRWLLNKSIPGVPEIVSVSIVGIVFLQVSITLRTERFIRSDALVARIKNRSVVQGLEIFNDLAGCAVTLILILSGWRLLGRSYSKGEFIGEYGHFTMTVWPIKAVIVVGSTFLFIQYARRLWSGLCMMSAKESQS